jgi:hypothetical protein
MGGGWWEHCGYVTQAHWSNAFDAGSTHYLGKWEVEGPGNLEFFGPQMALAFWLDAISQGTKKS